MLAFPGCATSAGQLLTETENPGGSKGFLGHHGMPSLLSEVVQGLAVARKTTEEDIIRTVLGSFAACCGRGLRLG